MSSSIKSRLCKETSRDHTLLKPHKKNTPLAPIANANTSAADPEGLLCTAETHLTRALALLDGLNWRNRNQHRLCRWWAEFGITRRALRRLADEVVRNSNALTVRKKKSGMGNAQASGGVGERVVARAGHFCGMIVPRGYLAFSQLVADPQYAPIGLVLLGLLAELNPVIRALAPLPAAPVDGEDEKITETAASSAKLSIHMASFADAETAASQHAEDLGVGVSRQDTAASPKSPSPSPPPPVSTTRSVTPTKNSAQTAWFISSATRRNPPSHADVSPPPTPLDRPSRNEFADLFGALDDSERPSKRTKKNRSSGAPAIESARKSKLKEKDQKKAKKARKKSSQDEFVALFRSLNS